MLTSLSESYGLNGPLLIWDVKQDRAKRANKKIRPTLRIICHGNFEDLGILIGEW